MMKWQYNKYGHILLTDLTTNEEIYMQIDYDVLSFFETIGLNPDDVNIGDFDTLDDNWGYFNN